MDNSFPRENNKTSEHKGINYHKTRKYWTARLTINNKRKEIGRFKTQEEATASINSYKEKYPELFPKLLFKL